MAARPEEGIAPVATRWRRYGQDRLYVNDEQGERLGYRDLATGQDHPDSPAYAETVARVAEMWLAAQESKASAQVDPPPAATERPWIDLSLNAAGTGVRDMALAKRAEAPIKTRVARLLGVHTDERAWRIGADGEERVAKELRRLAESEPLWTAIHSIPVGKRGADIDHLVMGPGGAFTINTKCHPDADIWVGGDAFLVNGQRTPYVRNARHEAQRASRLLSDAAGVPVHVEALIVPVLCNLPLTIKSPPADGVHVVARKQLTRWLQRLGPTLTQERLAVIWEAARRSTTWA